MSVDFIDNNEVFKQAKGKHGEEEIEKLLDEHEDEIADIGLVMAHQTLQSILESIEGIKTGLQDEIEMIEDHFEDGEEE